MSFRNNNATLIGKLATEPTFKTTQDGKEFKCSFTMAVLRPRRPGQERPDVDFINCSMYGGDGRMGKCHNLSKGSRVQVSGRITVDRYIKDGERRTTLPYVNIEDFMFLDPRKEKDSDSADGE